MNKKSLTEADTRLTATHLLDALVAELTSSANGATPSQPGATPQEKSRQ